MKKIYRVALSEEEEAQLQALIFKGKTSACKVTRARILLLAHAGEKEAAIARALQTSVSTVERTRKNLVLEGCEAALEEAPRAGAKPKLDAKGHGFLVALACSTPPLGREGWTLELLSERLVALGYVESFSREAVRRARKKTRSSPGCISSGPCRSRPLLPDGQFGLLTYGGIVTTLVSSVMLIVALTRPAQLPVCWAREVGRGIMDCALETTR